jgi:mRNA interferase RelE/StbE
MAQYKIEVSATAERQLKKLPREDAVQIFKMISLLAHDPRPNNCKKMRGFDSICRLRIGDYRVIYEIDSDHILVIILKIGHRKDIYRH